MRVSVSKTMNHKRSILGLFTVLQDLPIDSYDFYLEGFQADAYISGSLNYRGETVSAVIGSAEFFEDTLLQQTGLTSGLRLQNEGGTFGTVQIPDGSGGFRLPNNARYINPSATTINLAFGVNKDNWGAELFIDNITDEEAPIVQVAGKFTPEITVPTPINIHDVSDGF